jgi:threonine synthase
MAVSVTDDEIFIELRRVSRLEGILLCPEGAACIAAAAKLVQSGFIEPSNKVLLFNTGSGYKYSEVLRQL